MSKKSLVECDGCGREALEENTKDWIHTVFDVGRHGKEEIDCCSFSCIGRYAMRREKELNPDHG